MNQVFGFLYAMHKHSLIFPLIYKKEFDALLEILHVVGV